MVKPLASHQCGPGSTPGVDAICGLSLLMVLPFAPRGFSLGTPVFPSPQKPTLPNAKSILDARTRLNEFNELLSASWVKKQFTFTFTIRCLLGHPKKIIKPSKAGLFWTNSVSWNNGNGDYRKANELCTSCFCWRGRRLSFPPWHKYLPCNCEGLISPFWPWLWQCPSLQQKCSSQLFLHLREGDLTTLKRGIRRF